MATLPVLVMRTVWAELVELIMVGGKVRLEGNTVKELTG